MLKQQFFFAAIIFFAISACLPEPKKENLFSKGKSLGKNTNEKLEEASGIVASAINKNFLWTHNDGGPPDLFLLDTNAVTLKTFRLHGIKNRDMEDIALGPGPVAGKVYIYLGDIGDNFARNEFKYIYRIEEPSMDDQSLITRFDTLIVKLSDEMRDSETLLSDPVSGNLYIISKRDSPVGLYEIKHPVTKDTLVAQRIAEIPLRAIVGGDISSDGSEILLKSYEKIYYWKRQGSESIAETLTRRPIELPYDVEPQGEAIGWARDASGFYTISENANGNRARLYYYRRLRK